MSENDSDKKQKLLLEIGTAIEKYRKYRQWSAALQWSVLLLVTIAGFFTTAAGGIELGTTTPVAAAGVELGTTTPVWFADPIALTIWGLIAAIGSMIVQNANPAKMAEKFEKKKDAMRAIRTALEYRNLQLRVAAELVEIARADPAQALEVLSNMPSG